VEQPAGLRSERRALVEQVADLTTELQSVIDAAVDANLDDEHDPEGSTVAFERARVSALLARATARLGELDRAISNVDAGTYGLCEGCGQPIAAERLVALPGASTCIDCATRATSWTMRGLR
jgi:RNA polymerase-binding transcription factor DksA